MKKELHGYLNQTESKGMIVLGGKHYYPDEEDKVEGYISSSPRETVCTINLEAIVSRPQSTYKTNNEK